MDGKKNKVDDSQISDEKEEIMRIILEALDKIVEKFQQLLEMPQTQEEDCPMDIEVQVSYDFDIDTMVGATEALFGDEDSQMVDSCTTGNAKQA